MTLRPDILAWWQKAVIYQIYPRSFQDTNGDGVGDLEGIRRRLDYLAWLGVDAIWISPFYPSPMADFGYDIANFCDIDPLFGTLADFERLIEAAHGRGIKVILDYVPNHTSDRHSWFIESRSSRHNPRRDWYIWRDGKPDGSPPTNWSSNFGGSAWERDEATGQFYYHAFLPQQPDLNWRNPDVREAMQDVLRFWLLRGVDGFRVDAITNLVEDDLLREDAPRPAPESPSLPDRLNRVFTADRPETHGFVADMRAVLDAADERVLIGEAHLPVARIMAYYGGKRPGFHLPFNFILLHTPWNARSVEAAIDRYMNLLPEGAWPNWVLGNHDEPRIASRIGRAQARISAMLTMTMIGTPFVYYGEEIGAVDTEIPESLVRDPVTTSLGRGLGRDPQRTPLPWDASGNGGFTTGEPWLPLGADHVTHNVAALRADPGSILNLYRRLIALRRTEPALACGTYSPDAYHGDLIGFRRRSAGQELLVLLNLGSSPQPAQLPRPGHILVSTHFDRVADPVQTEVALRADEGLIVQLA